MRFTILLNIIKMDGGLAMVKSIIDVINENKDRIIVSWSLNSED